MTWRYVFIAVLALVGLSLGYWYRYRTLKQRMIGQLMWQASQYAGYDETAFYEGGRPDIADVVKGLRAERERLIVEIGNVADRSHLVGVRDQDLLFADCVPILDVALREAFRGTLREPQYMGTLREFFQETSRLADHFANTPHGMSLKKWAERAHIWTEVLILYTLDLAEFSKDNDGR